MTPEAARKKECAVEIVRALARRRHTSYFAGGCVRDLLLKTEPHDYDVATTASPEEIESLFPKTLPVGKQFGVILVLMDDIPYEVATFRKEGGYHDGRRPSWVESAGPEEDAKRRDFTINGLFYDPLAGKIIDYVGGEKDLTAKTLRAIGDPEERFEEDKLRLLRGVSLRGRG